MRKHDTNKTKNVRIYLYSNAYTYLLNLYCIYIKLYHTFYIVILFCMSKTSIDRKISKQQKQNSMGKILIYLDWKDVLLIKPSKVWIPKSFSMSVVWNIWWISPLGVTLMFTALFQNLVKWIFLELFSWQHLYASCWFS